MSMLGPTPTGKRAEAVGETIASYPTYEGAQKAVSALIAGEVPARDIAIVGQGLRSIERVTGRLGYATAARSGAVNGLLIGLFFSAILVLGSPSVPIQAFVGVLFVGIALGMLLSIVTYSFVRRRRDFASVTQVVADRYEVNVAASSVQRARQVLGPISAPVDPIAADHTPAATPSPAYEPPQYGERVAADDVPEPDASEPDEPEASGAHPEPPLPERPDAPEPEPAPPETRPEPAS